MSIISIAQIVVSILLIGVILMQERSAGSGGLFGGGGEGTYYQARRGVEKAIFIATIILLALFAIVSLLNLIL